MRVTIILGVLAAVISIGLSGHSPAAAQTTAKIDFGELAPQWLRESESYVLGCVPENWDLLAQSKVKFITHCPVDREFFARCHALGIRCFPYVTFYHGDAAQSEPDINIKAAPEWIEVDAEGRFKRSAFWECEDNKNKYLLCPNAEAGQEAMAARVQQVMEMGADGVFLDVIRAREPCFGPKFGKHQHLYDDQNHAFAMLLKRIRELIKRQQPEGALLVNSGDPLSIPGEFWKYIDADMLESYICTWVSKDRLPDWKTNWHAQGAKLRPLLEAGKQVQALSFLGHTPYGVKEDAFFCYATARLAGFVWAGEGAFMRSETASLYRLSLGKPLNEEVEEGGVYWRAFEKGLVAVNSDRERAGTVTIKPPIPTTLFCDLFGSGAEHWEPCERGGYSIDTDEKHGGTHSARCVNATTGDAGGLRQYVELNQTTPEPLVVGGWSKALNVSGESDGNYALYVDIRYRDETSLYGQVAPFACGTHDWQFASVTIRPTKPIKSLTYHALFRNKSGNVWFDDVSLKVADDSQSSEELLRNGRFEESSSRGFVVDAAATGKLSLPPYSGRVFLYAPARMNDSGKSDSKLTIVTNPALGEVCFRVDGFDYWTHAGYWGTDYMMGPKFGLLSIRFDTPGKHVVEVIDVVAADMKTSAAYNSSERLGQAMDPSNPTKPSEGRKFRFHGWTGPITSDQARIEIDVAGDTRLNATFEVEK